MTHISIGYLINDFDHPSSSLLSSNIYEAFIECRDMEFDFIIIEVSRPSYAVDKYGNNIPVSGDFILLNSSWNPHIVLKIPDAIINNLESVDLIEVEKAKKNFFELLEWIVHLGLHVVYISIPFYYTPVNFIKLINQCLKEYNNLSFWLEFPLQICTNIPRDLSLSDPVSIDVSFLPYDSWGLWNLINSSCDSDKIHNLHCVLKLVSGMNYLKRDGDFPNSDFKFQFDLPLILTSITRWGSEPISAIGFFFFFFLSFIFFFM
jgi:hypothetical protein